MTATAGGTAAGTATTGVLRVGVLQATSVVGAAGPNLDVVAAAAADAAAAGCRLLVTPELFVSGYAPRAVADDDGESHRRRLRAVAAEHGLWLVASTVEHTGAEGLPGPRHIVASLLDDTGREVTRYRKQRLFGPQEEAVFTPGRRAPDVVDVDGVQVALGVCFDVEFPEFVRGVAARGAQLLAVPTAVPVREAGARCDPRLVSTLLVPARALENGIALAYANHHGPGFTGLSCVADPFGRDDGPGGGRAGEDAAALLVADVGVGDVERARRETPYLQVARTPLAGAEETTA